jgi:uncharacterized membrane protein
MYLFLKLVHLLGVVMFLGNILVGVFWKLSGDSSGNPAVMAYTMASIIKADRIFSVPGILILLIGGIAAAVVGNYPILGTGWILWSLIAFIFAGLAAIPLSRIQSGLLSAVQHANMQEYARLSKGWNVWGTVALVLPFIAFVIMILKPVLPAFHR